MLLDTSGLLCLIHRREAQHERAISLYDAATTRVTHSYVLGEFVSLARPTDLADNLDHYLYGTPKRK